MTDSREFRVTVQLGSEIRPTVYDVDDVDTAEHAEAKVRGWYAVGNPDEVITRIEVEKT